MIGATAAFELKRPRVAIGSRVNIVRRVLNSCGEWRRPRACTRSHQLEFGLVLERKPTRTFKPDQIGDGTSTRKFLAITHRSLLRRWSQFEGSVCDFRRVDK